MTTIDRDEEDTIAFLAKWQDLLIMRRLMRHTGLTKSGVLKSAIRALVREAGLEADVESEMCAAEQIDPGVGPLAPTGTEAP